MSRTTRRLKDKTKKRGYWSFWREWSVTDEERAKWQRDKYSQTNMLQNLQNATNKKRRSAWRCDKRKIMQDIEFDVVDLERLYKGEIWNWD